MKRYIVFLTFSMSLLGQEKEKEVDLSLSYENNQNNQQGRHKDTHHASLYALVKELQNYTHNIVSEDFHWNNIFIQYDEVFKKRYPVISSKLSDIQNLNFIQNIGNGYCGYYAAGAPKYFVVQALLKYMSVDPYVKHLLSDKKTVRLMLQAISSESQDKDFILRIKDRYNIVFEKHKEKYNNYNGAVVYNNENFHEIYNYLVNEQNFLPFLKDYFFQKNRESRLLDHHILAFAYLTQQNIIIVKKEKKAQDSTYTYKVSGTHFHTKHIDDTTPFRVIVRDSGHYNMVFTGHESSKDLYYMLQHGLRGLEYRILQPYMRSQADYQNDLKTYELLLEESIISQDEYQTLCEKLKDESEALQNQKGREEKVKNYMTFVYFKQHVMDALKDLFSSSDGAVLYQDHVSYATQEEALDNESWDYKEEDINRFKMPKNIVFPFFIEENKN